MAFLALEDGFAARPHSPLHASMSLRSTSISARQRTICPVSECAGTASWPQSVLTVRICPTRRYKGDGAVEGSPWLYDGATPPRLGVAPDTFLHHCVMEGTSTGHSPPQEGRGNSTVMPWTRLCARWRVGPTWLVWWRCAPGTSRIDSWTHAHPTFCHMRVPRSRTLWTEDIVLHLPVSSGRGGQQGEQLCRRCFVCCDVGAPIFHPSSHEEGERSSDPN